MSRFNSSKSNMVGVAQIATQLKSDITAQGDDFIRPGNAEAVTVSIESLDPQALSRHEASFGDVRNSIIASLEAANIEVDQDGVGLEAASIIAMGLGNPEDYHSAATRATVTAGDNVTVIPDAQGVPAMEAFDQNAIGNYQHYSLAFNLESAQQDEFGETLFA